MSAVIHQLGRRRAPCSTTIGHSLAGVALAMLATSGALAAPAASQAPQAAEAAASSAAISLRQVEVQGTSTGARDAKTVGQLLKAEALFEKARAMAPQARFEFKVYGRRDSEQWADVDLGLLTRQGRVPVRLDAEGRFSIEAAWRTLDEDTEIRSRLREGAVTWRPYITSPGSSERVRRLGDLRLQCLTGFYSGVARSSGMWLISALKFLSVQEADGCSQKTTGWSNFADAPVFGVRLAYGDQVQDLSQNLIAGLSDGGGSEFDWGFALRDRLFRLPMGDKRWPDDTRVEFEYMADPPGPVDAVLLASAHPLAVAARTLTPQISTWAELQGQLGRPRGMFQYASGWRVARYAVSAAARPAKAASAEQELRAAPAEAEALAASAPLAATPPLTQTTRGASEGSLELVLLFDESDRLVKYALRQMGMRRASEKAELPWRTE